MWNELSRYLLPGEVDERDKPYIKNLLYLTSGLGALLTAVFFLVDIPGGWNAITMASGVGFAVSLLSLFLVYQDALLFPRTVFPLLALTLASFLVITGNGFYDSSMYIYPVVLLLSGLLLGSGGVAIYTLLSLLILSLVMVLQLSGLIIPTFELMEANENMVFYWGVTGFIGALLYMTLANLSKNLKKARLHAQELSERLHEREVGQVALEGRLIQQAQMIEKIRREAEMTNQALTEQIWRTQGYALLSKQMRGEQNMPALAQNVIRFLCEYLEAPVGILFILEGRRLLSTGSYALSAVEDRPAEFQLGEGIIGQVAHTQEEVLLDNLPDNYLTITSGLGQQQPAQALALPFLYEGRVIGVIEIGAWHPFPFSHLQFLREAMENIGIVFHTARTRRTIDRLLAETQEQAEELQAREEELMAINDQLENQRRRSLHRGHEGETS